MNYSYGTNADKYLNEDGLQYLIAKLKEDFSGGTGTVDLTDYYNKLEVDTLLSNIDGGSGTVGADGIGILSVALTNYELIITLTDNTVINLGNVRGANGTNGSDGADGINGVDGSDGIQGLTGTNGIDGTNGRGITSVVKTGTVELVDTYTITYSDATTSTFTVTNGADGSGGSGGGSINYNYEEQLTGELWVDGRPIYRKTILYDNSAGDVTFSVPHNITNYDYCVRFVHSMPGSPNDWIGGATIFHPDVIAQTTVPNITKYMTTCQINSTSIYVKSGSWMSGLLHYFIMDYTKTV